MNVMIKTLGIDDLGILLSSGSDVFDNAIQPELAKAYLERDDYFIVVALDGDMVVGMASGFTYFHPDKPVEFYVNDVGVHDDYLRQGIAKKMMAALFECAHERGCKSCWLGVEMGNVAADALYASIGGEQQPMKYFEFDLTK